MMWFHDTFIAIVQDAGFHMGWEQLHVLLLNMFNSSRQQVNIVFTKDGICTLIDIIIVDPTWVDLLPQSCATQGFVTSNVVQTKEWSYHDWHLGNQFLP